MDELYMEAAQIQLVAGLDHIEGDARYPVLLQLQIHQSQGQLGAVKGHGHLPEHIGRCADVILVAVGQQHTADAAAVFDQVRNIGDHQVYAQHILLGKNRAAVHNENILAVFNDGNVFAELVHAAQGDDLESLFGSCHVGLLLSACAHANQIEKRYTILACKRCDSSACNAF